MSSRTKNFFAEHKPAIIIAVAVFLISIIFSFYFQIQPMVDAKAYDRIGWNLAQGLGYRIYTDTELAKDPAIDRVGPGYQFFLGGVYYVFGHSYKAVWIIQAILRGLSVILLYLICLRIFGEEKGKKIGMFAVLIFGLYPDLVENAGMLMTETLAIFLVLSVVYLFFRFYQNQNLINLFLLALFSFLLIMVRSNSALLALFIFGIFIYKKWFRHAFFLLLFLIILMAPWTIRNYNLYHKFIPTCVAGGYDIWVGNNINATGELENYPEIEAYAKEHGLIETNAYGVKQALVFAKGHPLKFIWLQMRKALIYFSIFRPMGFWFYFSPLHQGIMLALSGLASVIIFVLGFAGIYYLIKEKNELLILFLLLAAAMPLGVIPIVVETRYRFVLYPFLAVLAGLYIYKFLSRDQSRYKYLIRSASIVLAVGLADGILSFKTLLGRITSIDLFKFINR